MTIPLCEAVSRFRDRADSDKPNPSPNHVSGKGPRDDTVAMRERQDLDSARERIAGFLRFNGHQGGCGVLIEQHEPGGDAYRNPTTAH